jgi:hypothetical protein
MDGETLFCGSSRAGGCVGEAGGFVAAAGRSPLRRRDQHRDQLGRSLRGDRQHRAPGTMGGHTSKKLSGEHAAWLRERCREKAFTLRGLVKELAHERGLMFDYRSMWEFRPYRASHTKTYGPPRLQVALRWRLLGLRERIRHVGRWPTPRWRSARPGPHKRHGIACRFLCQADEAPSRPSGHLPVHPQTPVDAAAGSAAAP